MSYADFSHENISQKFSHRHWFLLHALSIFVGLSALFIIIHTAIPSLLALSISHAFMLSLLVGVTDYKYMVVNPELLIITFASFVLYGLLETSNMIHIILSMSGFALSIVLAKIFSINGGDALCLGLVVAWSVMHWNTIIAWPIIVASVGIALIVFARIQQYSQKTMGASLWILLPWGLISFSFAMATLV